MVRLYQFMYFPYVINTRRFSKLTTQLLFLSGMICSALQVLAQTSQPAGQEPHRSDNLTADKKNASVLKAVTVRSRNRVEEIQEIPVSISTVSGAELQQFWFGPQSNTNPLRYIERRHSHCC